MGKILNPTLPEKNKSDISKNKIYIPALIIVLLIVLIANEYRFQALNIKIKGENLQSGADNISAIQKSINEIKKTIVENREKYDAIHSRVENFEVNALQMSNDYKLIKASKDSIESLNNTVLQLKNSTDVNNRMQVDGLEKQVAKLEEKFESFVKEYKVSTENTSKELKSEQRKLSLSLSLLDASLKDINKKTTSYEIFKDQVISDLKYDRNILAELVKKTGLKPESGF